jgi:hypothetical protein
MRNLKKLLAVIMAVAMLASIMVPALAADYDDDAQKLYNLGLFKGSSGSSYQPDLDGKLTREQGLTLMIRAMGKDEEALGMSEAEINEQLAKVEDAADITDWARPYVAYAVKNGLTKGIGGATPPNIKFGAQLDLSGKEFINFMLYAMGYTDAWDIVLDKAVEIGMLTAGEAVKFGSMDVIIRDVAIGIMAGSMGGTTAAGITLAQALVEAGVVSEEDMVEAGYMDPIVTPTPEPEELTAEAYADNLIQLNVVFSAEVDKESAEDKDNYSIEKVKIAGAALQDDGVTVVLTLAYDDARKQQDVVDLTVDGVKALDGTAIDEFTIEDIEFIDTTIPTALDADVIGKDTIKVTFSEPMKGKADGDDYVLNKKDFVVNGGKSYVRSVKLQNNYTEALVEMYSDLKEGDLTIQIKSGSEDFAGFGVIGKTFDLEVVPDEEDPEVIGYEKASRTEVTLIWNEDIKQNCKDDKIGEYFYHTNSKNPANEIKVDGNKVTIKFKYEDDDDYRLPNGTAYVYVMKEAVKDYWDNKNTQQMIMIEVVPDEEPPAVDKIEVKDEHIIDITFTEDLAKGSDDKDNFTILDDDGDEVKNIIKTAKLEGKKITITFKEDLSGDYSIVIEDVKDKADNKMDKTTVPFTVGDKTPPESGKFKGTLYRPAAKDQMIKIDFDDVMETEGKYSVTDVENYVIVNRTTGAEECKLEKIEGVEIDVVDDGKSVEIYIPSKEDVKDDVDKPEDGKHYFDFAIETDDEGDDVSKYSIQISRVADAAGNKMDKMYEVIKIYASDTIDILKAQATARDTIEITFADNVTVFEASDIWFQVKDGTADGDFLDQDKDIAGVSTKLNDDGNTVAVFTLDDDLLDYYAKYAENGKEVKVWVKPYKDGKTESENRYGKTLTLYEGTKTVEDKIAPALYDKVSEAKDEFVKKYMKLEVVKDYAGEKAQLSTVSGEVYGIYATLYFGEEITVDDDLKALAGSDFVITYEDDKLVNGKDYAVVNWGVDGDGIGFVTIRFKGEDIKEGDIRIGGKLDGDLVIELAGDVDYLTDKAGNALKAFDAIELDNVNISYNNPGV